MRDEFLDQLHDEYHREYAAYAHRRAFWETVATVLAAAFLGAAFLGAALSVLWLLSR